MEKYKQELSKLNDEQRKAVETIEGPVLVIAGPGTGKTQLVSTRAAYILRNTQVETSNILCLTFTENAAFNMKQRMVGIIGESAYKITTSTYHAFGSELMQRFPEYFGDQLNSKPIDQLMQYYLIKGIIDDLEYDNPLKKSKYYIKDLISTISDMKSNLITPDNLEIVAKKNLDFTARVNKIIESALSGVGRMSKKILPKFEKLLLESKSLVKNDELSEQFYDTLELAIDGVEDNNTKTLTSWKNDWLDKDLNGNFALAGKITNEKLLALADIYRQYTKELESKRYFDFADMILLAIKGLDNNPDFRYTLQEQYQYIMLDEFQDTNKAQMRLVELLTDNPVYEKKANIMAVGDDNQAIFAFQGANYSNIEKFKTIYKDIEIIELTDNYRSHQNILETSINLAKQIETSLKRKSRGLISKSKINNEVIERRDFKTDVAQFAWVAEQIAKLIKNGLNPSEIAVIAPKHSLIEPLMPYLRNNKIPVYYEKRENILEDKHINQIIMSAQLVIAMAKKDKTVIDSLFSEILSYDYWEIDIKKLWEIAETAHVKKISWSGLLKKDKKLSEIYYYFARLASIKNNESLEIMLDYLTGVQPVKLSNKTDFSSPFYSYHFSNISSKNSDPNFWNLLSNLTVLRQNLRDRQTNYTSVLKLDDFLDFIDMHQQADIKILNTSPYNEQEDSVQLMTAYGAKGLEYNTVFMLACIDEAWGPSTKEKSNNVPLPQNLKYIRYGGADDDERLRLLYVAMTRAKQRLYMTSYRNNYANKPTSRIRFFEEQDFEGEIISPHLPEKNQKIVYQDNHAPKLDELRHYWTDIHTEALKNSKLSALLKPKLDQYQLAPTHLNNFTDVIDGGPEQFYLNTILRFPSTINVASAYGDAVHTTLHWMHLQLKENGKMPTTKAVISKFNELMLKKPLSERDIKQLTNRGQKTLNIYLKMAKSEFSKGDEPEFNFRDQGVLVGNARITGKIDKLLIDKKKREIVVVDYKTGQAYDKWNDSNKKLHNYKQQLYFYKLLVEGSYKFDGYKVTSAYLDFVESENNKQRKLYLSFNSKEQHDLIKLIKAVWAHIQNLDFPDISSYQKQTKGIKQFEKDLKDKKI